MNSSRNEYAGDVKRLKTETIDSSSSDDIIATSLCLGLLLCTGTLINYCCALLVCVATISSNIEFWIGFLSISDNRMLLFGSIKSPRLIDETSAIALRPPSL